MTSLVSDNPRKLAAMVREAQVAQMRDADERLALYQRTHVYHAIAGCRALQRSQRAGDASLDAYKR